MNIGDRLKRVRDVLVQQRTSPAIDAAIDWLTYLLGLLPDEFFGKIAQVGNKIINDERLNQRFEAVKRQVLEVNGAIESMQTGLDRVAAIASAAASEKKIQSAVLAFAEELKSSVRQHPTEFNVETVNWSEQQILNCIIEADSVQFSADQQSRNEIANSVIKANQTTLRATNMSANVIRDSNFQGKAGSIGMHGTHIQQGQVSMKDAAIGYSGENSGTQMGGWYMGTDAQGNFVIGTRPENLNAQCPSCRRQFTIARSALVGRSHFKCPLCGHVAQLPRIQ